MGGRGADRRSAMNWSNSALSWRSAGVRGSRRTRFAPPPTGAASRRGIRRRRVATGRPLVAVAVASAACVAPFGPGRDAGLPGVAALRALAVRRLVLLVPLVPATAAAPAAGDHHEDDPGERERPEQHAADVPGGEQEDDE